MVLLNDYQKVNSIGMEKPKIQESSDAPVRFVGDRMTNIIHDRLCVKINEISENDMINFSELDKSMIICKTCQRKIYIRNAIKDDDNFLWYLEFFDKANYGTNNLKGFIYMQEVELLKISDIELQIKYKDDTWRVAYVKRNRYNLFHNNYIATSVYDRQIIPEKFHSQRKEPMRLKDSFRYIAMYDWKSHFSQCDTL